LKALMFTLPNGSFNFPLKGLVFTSPNGSFSFPMKGLVGTSPNGSISLHIFNGHFSESSVFSEPHLSLLEHILDLFLVPVPQDPVHFDHFPHGSHAAQSLLSLRFSVHVTAGAERQDLFLVETPLPHCLHSLQAPHLPILEGHFFNSQFIESCVFSEPHPSMLGHFLVLFLFPAPQVREHADQ